MVLSREEVYQGIFAASVGRSARRRSRPFVFLQMATAILFFASCAVAASDVALACSSRALPPAEPYRWYPKLDLARIPFHVSDGPWGPRAKIAAPAEPVIRRTISVTSATQLAAEALIPGTRIVVAADYIGPTVVFGDVMDIDIVIPAGKRIASLSIGRYTPRSVTRRVRIRGLTPGAHSGGVVGQIVFLSNPATDLIVDGVDLNGHNGDGGSLLLQFAWPAERVAIVNIRGHSVGSATLGGGIDVVFAGNRIFSGARPREVNGYPDGWGIRGDNRGPGSRMVVYDNRIDGNRFHRLRVHPGPGEVQYAWVANNTFVDPHEARIFAAIDMSDTRTFYSAVWAVCNQVFAHSVCMPPSFEAPHSRYARLTSNNFFGSFTEAGQRHRQSMHGPDRDYLSGNTFRSWQAPPMWESPGDPTAVPLPPLVPERYKPALIERPCPPL